MSLPAETAAGAPPPGWCPNCGERAHGHYCANCGQETRLALPTFMAFMREAAGRYVALDGRTWRTLFALVARPGFLTLEYFRGRRRRYIRPARLFLVLYLLLFAEIGIVLPSGGIGDEFVVIKSDPAVATKPPESGSAPSAGATGRKEAGPTAGAKGLVDVEDNTLIGFDDQLNMTLRWGGNEVRLPDAVEKRYEHFRKLSRTEKLERLYAGVLRLGPYAMAALLPVFALLMKLAYLGRSTRYPGRPRQYAEHLVYSAHLHAFAAIAIMLLLAVPASMPPVSAAIGLYVVYYVLRARQNVYRGRWWAGFLRSFVIAIVYTVLVAVAIAGLLGIATMIQ